MTVRLLSSCDFGLEARLRRVIRHRSSASGRRPKHAGRDYKEGAQLSYFQRLVALVCNVRQILPDKKYKSSSTKTTLLARSAKICSAIAFLIIAGVVLAGCSSFTDWTSNQDQRPSINSPWPNVYGNFHAYQVSAIEPRPFASLIQHSFSEEGGDFDPDISPNGQWMAFCSLRNSPNPDIYIKQPHGSTATRLTSDPASEIQPCFSPLGDKIAYASNRSGDWDLWVVGADGTNPVRLTSAASDDIHPAWSPDGTHIVYCSYGARSQQWELWIVDVENPSTKKWIGYGLFPQWSPNPQVPKIAFQLARSRGSQWFSVWTVDYVDGEAKYPTEIVSNVNYACISPTWSPDGRSIAYSTIAQANLDNQNNAVPQTQEDVWVIDLDGRNNLRLTSSDAANFSPNWAPDGRVFFCSDRKGIANVWSIMPNQVNFAAEEPVDLTSHPQGGILAN